MCPQRLEITAAELQTERIESDHHQGDVGITEPNEDNGQQGAGERLD